MRRLFPLVALLALLGPAPGQKADPKKPPKDEKNYGDKTDVRGTTNVNHVAVAELPPDSVGVAPCRQIESETASSPVT